jgi:GMP synthase-like glutamine amidotransferase
MSELSVQVLQHVPFEGLGSIDAWLEAREAKVSITRLFAEETPPAVDDVDWVIVLGGPMSVNDEEGFPWLREEKAFIAEAIESDRVVLGICLGAQLIASSLGALVFRNAQREVGWHRISTAPGAAGSPFAELFGGREVLHWHGETYVLPEGATHLARSAACANQAFSIGTRVLGLQFHLETTPEGARALCDHSPEDLRPGPWIQSRDEILRDGGRFASLNAVMDRALDLLAETT